MENAADPSSTTFKDRGMYMLSPKGLHVLERFITKNGISADHLLRVYATQTVCMKLLHLERRNSDDEIMVTKGAIEILFRRLVGKRPNIANNNLNDEQFIASQSPATRSGTIPQNLQDDWDRMGGILLKKSFLPSLKGKPTEPAELVFLATAAMDWLIDYTTIGGKDEAAEVCGQFVRYGFIKVVNDKSAKVLDSSKIMTVKAGGPGGGAGAMMVSCESLEVQLHIQLKIG